MGCMDETALNYSPEANMADGSCEYTDEGYNCYYPADPVFVNWLGTK